MKKLFAWVMATLGLTTACGGQNFENTDVKGFAALIDSGGVALLDVRTAGEYAEGHLAGAVNVDVNADNFVALADSVLPAGATVAVYCRSGRRSATAASQLAAKGRRVVNLRGGILAWQGAGMPVTTAATTSYETDTFTTPGGKPVTLHALMHGSVRITAGGVEIYVDPVTRLGDRTVDFAALPKADYILVTHEHSDHYAPAAIEALTKQGTRLITNARVAGMLGRGEVMANGDTLRLNAFIALEAVPAYNTTEGHLQYHPRGRDNGFVLDVDGLRLYLAGDTEDIPEMASLGRIDIAWLPCNQPYTMTVEQLLRAARVVKPRVLFPYHYGQTDVSGIPAALAADGIDVRVRHYE